MADVPKIVVDGWYIIKCFPLKQLKVLNQINFTNIYVLRMRQMIHITYHFISEESRKLLLSHSLLSWYKVVIIEMFSWLRTESFLCLVGFIWEYNLSIKN